MPTIVIVIAIATITTVLIGQTATLTVGGTMRSWGLIAQIIDTSSRHNISPQSSACGSRILPLPLHPERKSFI